MGGHGSSSGQSRGATSAPLALIARVQVALLLAATISSALQPVSASSAPQAQPEPQAYGEQSGVNIGEQAGGEQQPEGHDDEALPDVEAEDVVTSDDVQRMLVSQLESNIAVLQRAYEFDLKRVLAPEDAAIVGKPPGELALDIIYGWLIKSLPMPKRRRAQHAKEESHPESESRPPPKDTMRMALGQMALRKALLVRALRGQVMPDTDWAAAAKSAQDDGEGDGEDGPVFSMLMHFGFDGSQSYYMSQPSDHSLCRKGLVFNPFTNSCVVPIQAPRDGLHNQSGGGQQKAHCVFSTNMNVSLGLYRELRRNRNHLRNQYAQTLRVNVSAIEVFEILLVRVSPHCAHNSSVWIEDEELDDDDIPESRDDYNRSRCYAIVKLHVVVARHGPDVHRAQCSPLNVFMSLGNNKFELQFSNDLATPESLQQIDRWCPREFRHYYGSSGYALYALDVRAHRVVGVRELTTGRAMADEFGLRRKTYLGPGNWIEYLFAIRDADDGDGASGTPMEQIYRTSEFDLTLGVADDPFEGQSNDSVVSVAIVCRAPRFHNETCNVLSLLSRADFTLYSNRSLALRVPSQNRCVAPARYYWPNTSHVEICELFLNPTARRQPAPACFGAALGVVLAVNRALGYALSLLSILSLAVLIGAYVWRADCHHLPGYLMLNLCAALLLAQATFVGGSFASNVAPLCTAAAALLHFAMLAQFCWMLATGLNVYLTFVHRAGKPSLSEGESRKRLLRLMCFAWGAPLAFVACCVAVDMVPFFWERLRVSISYGANVKREVDDGAGQQFRAQPAACWINNAGALRIVYALPILLTLVANAFFFARTVIEIARTKGPAEDAQSGAGPGRVGMLVSVNARLFVLMGLTWLVSLVPNAAELVAVVVSGQQRPAADLQRALCYLNVISQLVFTVLNGSLGAILLVAFLLRPRAIAALATRLRQRLRRRLCCGFDDTPKTQEGGALSKVNPNSHSNATLHADPVHPRDGGRGPSPGRGHRRPIRPQTGPRPASSFATISTTLDDTADESEPNSTRPALESSDQNLRLDTQHKQNSASEQSNKPIFVVKF